MKNKWFLFISSCNLIYRDYSNRAIRILFKAIEAMYVNLRVWIILHRPEIAEAVQPTVYDKSDRYSSSSRYPR